MTFRKQAMKYGSAVVLMSAGAAQAAVPVAVTTAIDTMSVDAQNVATLVLVAIISVFAIKFIRKGL